MQLFTGEDRCHANYIFELLCSGYNKEKIYANDTDDVYLIRVLSNQKLNEYIKEVAQIDFTVVDVQFSCRKKSKNI